MTYLKPLGLTDFDSFEGRISIQKMVYILRQFGADADLSFGYYWYAHGPYSPALTRTLFNHSAEEDADIDEPTQKQLRIMNDARTFLGKDAFSADQLELVASLIYLIRHQDEYGLTSKRDVIQFLKEKKPRFVGDEIEAAWMKIRKEGRLTSYLSALRGA